MSDEDAAYILEKCPACHPVCIDAPGFTVLWCVDHRPNSSGDEDSKMRRLFEGSVIISSHEPDPQTQRAWGDFLRSKRTRP